MATSSEEKPPSTNPSIPSSLPKPSSSPLTALTPHLAHLNRILSTTAGLDSTLLTLTYTLHLLHSRLLPLSTLHPAPRPISKLHPSTSSASTPLRTLALARLARTARSIAALTALVDDTRLFLRLWGLLGIWAWGSSVLASPPQDAVLRAIAYAQVGCNAVYQALENVAYLSSHRVLAWPAAKTEACYLWSARFWMGHVGLEFARLGREWVVRKRVADARGGRAEEVGVKMERVRVEARWWREVVVNVAYAPLTVHWSVEGGWVGEGVVGALGMVAGVVGFREVWERTA